MEVAICQDMCTTQKLFKDEFFVWAGKKYLPLQVSKLAAAITSTILSEIKVTFPVKLVAFFDVHPQSRRSKTLREDALFLSTRPSSRTRS